VGDVFSTADRICALQNQDHWKPSWSVQGVLKFRASCMCPIGKAEYQSTLYVTYFCKILSIYHQAFITVALDFLS